MTQEEDDDLDLLLFLADEAEGDDDIGDSGDAVANKPPPPPPPQPLATSVAKPLAAAASATHKKRAGRAGPDVDVLSGHRLKRRSMAPALEQSVARELSYFALARFAKEARNAPIVQDQCTVFVLSEALCKQSTKSAAKREFSIWSCVSLAADATHLLRNPVKLMLFGDAHEAHGRERPGGLFIVANPDFMDGNSRSNATTLCIQSGDQLRKIGVAADFGTCKGTRRDGKSCTMPLDTRNGHWCEFHASQAHKQASAKLRRASAGSAVPQWAKPPPSASLPRTQLPRQTFTSVVTARAANAGIVGSMKQRRLDERLLLSKMAPNVGGSGQPAPLRPGATAGLSKAEANRHRLVTPPQAAPAVLAPPPPQTVLSTGQRLLQSATERRRAAAVLAAAKVVMANGKSSKASVGDRKRADAPQLEPATGGAPKKSRLLKRPASAARTAAAPSLSSLRTVSLVPLPSSSGALTASRPAHPKTKQEKLRAGIDSRLPVLNTPIGRQAVGSKSACAKVGPATAAAAAAAAAAASKSAGRSDGASAAVQFSVFSAAALADVSARADEIRETRSANDHLRSKADDRRDLFFDALQQKDQAAQKLQTVMSIKVTGVACLQCHTLYDSSLPGPCKAAGHAFTVKKDVVKRFFMCLGCKKKSTTLNAKFPSTSCAGCGANGSGFKAISYAQFKNYAGSGNRGLAERAKPNLNHNRAVVRSRFEATFGGMGAGVN